MYIQVQHGVIFLLQAEVGRTSLTAVISILYPRHSPPIRLECPKKESTRAKKTPELCTYHLQVKNPGVNAKVRTIVLC